MPTVQEIYAVLDAAAPFSAQADWDNSGLLFGCKEQPVKRILLCLDLTAKAAARAVEVGADLVITHHPAIFQPIRSIAEQQPIYPLLANRIALIAAHTNLDIAPQVGVNASLMQLLGLQPLEQQPTCSPFLLFGSCDEIDPVAFAQAALERYRTNGIDCAAPCLINGGQPITRFAVCGGAGSDFAAEAQALGAQILITGEAKHHERVDAINSGMSLLLLGHHASEVPVLPGLATFLQLQFPDLEIFVDVVGPETAIF